MAGFRYATIAVVMAVLLVVVDGRSAAAQPPSNDPPPPSQNDFRRTYPRVKLIYYTGWEGKTWKEIRYFDLDQWTPGTDVIITAQWAERGTGDGQVSPGATAPGERQSNRPFYLRQARRSAYRTWTVEYVDGLEEGESHLFVGGAGLQKKGMMIYGDDDFLALLNIPTSGWHELGQAARLFRYRDLPSPVVSPSDTLIPR